MNPVTLRTKRSRCKTAIDNTLAFATKVTAETPREAIKARLEKLEVAWMDFQLYEDDLLQLPDQVSKYNEMEEKYFEARTALDCELNRLTPVDAEPNHSTTLNETMPRFLDQQCLIVKKLSDHKETNLPKLNIPEFRGDFNQWPSFQNLYESAVHNSRCLSNSQKFQYLKGLLRGSAASVVANFPITDENYLEAWEKLTKRFSRPKSIIASLIQDFMELLNIKGATSKRLRESLDKADEIIRGLKALGKEAERRDPWIILIFLTIEMCNPRKHKTNVFQKEVFKMHAAVTDNVITCPKCNEPHQLYHCLQFKEMDVNDRREFVRSNQLCYNCLSSFHKINFCKSLSSCRKCNGRHNSLLHLPTSLFNSQYPTPVNDLQPQKAINAHQSTSVGDSAIINTQHTSSSCDSASSSSLTQSQQSSQVSSSVNGLHSTHSLNTSQPQQSISTLPTAMILLQTAQGDFHHCRALLDSGSQATFITETCFRKLNFPRKNARILVNGLANTAITTTLGAVSLKIFSKNTKDSITTEAFILKTLTSKLPLTEYDVLSWNCIKSIELADPSFNVPGTIDVLLGADMVFQVIRNGRIQLSQGMLMAQYSMFGWIVCGKHTLENTLSDSTMMSNHIECNVDNTLEKFWEIDEIPVKKCLTTEEQQCEAHFEQTYTRDDNGRFVVSLPFQLPPKPLGDSLNNAIQRLFAMERKFKVNSEFRNEYIAFINEYIALGHMEQIPVSDIYKPSHETYYLPHHAVTKLTSSTTKLRVVFDASCKTSNTVSLNDNLMVGPKLQEDLYDILVRFRKYKVALCADVEKMYRQILITPSQCDYQRIVWRNEPTQPISHFRLKTVTYGTTSAPYLAVRSLQELARQQATEHPEAAQSVLNNFYVDDFMGGADTITAAIKLKDELSQLLKSGGFVLRKWMSNVAEVVNNNKINCISCCGNTEIDISTVHVLGLVWLPTKDCFSFKVSLETELVSTKRKMLSEAASIFDPIGWLAPSIIEIKILFQTLWFRKLNWDDTLPPDVLSKWKSIRNELACLEELLIPRWLNTTLNSQIQIHGFSDASELAYAAVIYIRSIDSSGKVAVNLLTAKTRVAPVKSMSVPRLELCGALLLSKLLKKVISALQLESAELYAWTDSKIVLAWLSGHPRSFKTFIANRTSEILETTSRKCWGYVRSSDNPADVASRGILPSRLKSLEIWWNGPPWLGQNQADWPHTIQIKPESMKDYIEEQRKPKIILTTMVKPPHFIDALLNKLSSWNAIQRVLCICLRFIDRCRKKPQPQSFITTVELTHAKNVIIKRVQETMFPDEIKALQKSIPVKPKSSLHSLNPFIDKDNIIRVGGRLQNSECVYNIKHPVILPKCSLSQKIIYDLHTKYLHPSVSLLISLVRQQYWIIACRSMVKLATNKCVTCFRYKTSVTSQLMGNLPSCRVTSCKPFAKVGIDYAGPLFIKLNNLRNAKSTKGYISVFVCMATKSIHLELVSDLTTNAFLAAFTRFISRRGYPNEVYSDNGTNFRGAHNTLYSIYNRLIANHDISNFLASRKIQWHFIPPGAPNFGGLWEAGVKSVKHHLVRVIGSKLLTFEEMNTLLVQIEALLNSRPLCALNSDDINDLNALTPGHFLIGQPLTTIPETPFGDVNISHLNRWQSIQYMQQGFWKRWHQEYLTTLQNRPKWKTQEQNLKVGELVLMKEENIPPSCWSLGRIIELHPGTDGLVRVVSVRIKSNILKRSINKICRLPEPECIDTNKTK